MSSILASFENSSHRIVRKTEQDLTGIENLFYKIFREKSYNNLVRPRDKRTGLTHLQTELKLLQLDLV